MPIQKQQDEPKAPDTPAAVRSKDHPDVDPAHIPAEVSTGHQPDAGGDKLLAAAQAKAPGLTAEFVKKHDLTAEFLAAVARGEESPPPVPGDGDLHYTPGGWVNVPKGVKPEDAHRNKISR